MFNWQTANYLENKEKDNGVQPCLYSPLIRKMTFIVDYGLLIIIHVGVGSSRMLEML